MNTTIDHYALKKLARSTLLDLLAQEVLNRVDCDKARYGWEEAEDLVYVAASELISEFYGSD